MFTNGAGVSSPPPPPSNTIPVKPTPPLARPSIIDDGMGKVITPEPQTKTLPKPPVGVSQHRYDDGMGRAISPEFLAITPPPKNCVCPDCISAGPAGGYNNPLECLVFSNTIGNLYRRSGLFNITNMEILDAKEGVIFRNNSFYIKAEWEALKNDAQPLFGINDLLWVVDVRTSHYYRVKVYAPSSSGGALHVDVKPVSGFTRDSTFFDTVNKNGEWTWNKKPIWVITSDRTLAASTHGFPHSVNGGLLDTRSGHVCIHFENTWVLSDSCRDEHKEAFDESVRAWEYVKVWD